MEMPAGGLPPLFSYAFIDWREQLEARPFGMRVEAGHGPAEGERFVPIEAEAFRYNRGRQASQ